MEHRALIGRDVPLRALGRGAAPRRRAVVLRLRRGGDRQDAAGGRGRGRGARTGWCCTASASSSAARSSRTRRSSRRCATCRPIGSRTISTSSRPRRAARWPRCCRARRRAAAARGGCYELLLDLLGRRSSARCCSCSRTSTGPTARRSRCSRSWPATCARERIVVARHLPRRRRAAGRAAPARGRAVAAPDACCGSSSSRSTRDDVARQLEAIAGGPVAGGARGRAARARGRQPVLRRGAVRGARERGSPATARPRRCWRAVERLDAARRARPPLAAGRRARVATRCSSALDVGRRDALRAALTPGVLVRERDGVAFRHGLIGEVVYERLLPAERARAAPRDRRARSTMPGAARAPLPPRRAARRRRSRRRSRPGIAGRARVRLRRGAPCTSSGARAARDERSTASSCSPAPPRPRASAATPSGRSRAAARRSRSSRRRPRARGSTSASASTTSGTTRPRSSATSEALRLAPGEPRLLAAKGHALMGLRRWERVARVLRGGARARAPRRGSRSASCSPSSASRRRARRTCGAALELSRLRRGHRARLPAPRRAAARARRPRGRAGRRWSTASARRRGSGCAARSGTSCTSTRADDLLRLGRWDEAAARVEEAARMDLSRTADALRRAIAGPAARAARRARRRRARSSTPPPTTACPRVPHAARRRPRGARARRAATRRRRRVHVDGALGGVEDPFYTPPLYSLGLRVEAELAERERARRREPDRDARGRAARRARRARRRRRTRCAHLALAARRARARRRRAGAGALARGGGGVRRARASPIPPPTRGCTRPRRCCSPAASGPAPARALAAAHADRGGARRARRCARRRTRSPGARGSSLGTAAAGAAPDDDGAGLTDARDRGPAAARRRPHQPRDRRAAVHQPEDRRRAHGAHLRQARRALARRGGRARAAARRLTPTMGGSGSPLGARRMRTLVGSRNARRPRNRPARHRCSQGTPDVTRKAPMSPSSIGRLCAGAAITLVLFVVADRLTPAGARRTPSPDARREIGRRAAGEDRVFARCAPGRPLVASRHAPLPPQPRRRRRCHGGGAGRRAARPGRRRHLRRRHQRGAPDRRQGRRRSSECARSSSRGTPRAATARAFPAPASSRRQARGRLLARPARAAGLAQCQGPLRGRRSSSSADLGTNVAAVQVEVTGKLKAKRASGTLSAIAKISGQGDRRRGHLLPDRQRSPGSPPVRPGSIFGGATSQGEPIVVRLARRRARASTT